MRFPQPKKVKGTPGFDEAYVHPCRDVTDGTIKEMAVGVRSPAYQSDGVMTPRGIRMTVRQAETFARVILEKVRRARRWNREQARRKR